MVRFHIDDLMSSHKDEKVNNNFYKCLNNKYGKHGKDTITQGKRHEYLGIWLEFGETGELLIDMSGYMQDMLDSYDGTLGGKDFSPTPMTAGGFMIRAGEPLGQKEKENFHTVVAKGLYACKRARPDMHMAIIHLTTRVKNPTTDDQKKLNRLMRYINRTKNDRLYLRNDDATVIKWYMDSSFVVHLDFRSHTSDMMTYGKGRAIIVSRKQKLNTRSSIKAELVGIDDVSTMIYGPKCL